jgi:hypothetical protein
MLTLLAVINFITTNPGITAAFIGLLLTLIGVLMGGYAAFIGSRLRELEEADEKLIYRVSMVEVCLGKYEEHVGAGDKILRELAARVERHMTEEEDKVWTGITKLNDRLIEIHTDNMEAHRMIGERLARVENRMPNGELSRITTMLESLISQAKK